MLKVGERAPDFSAESTTGKPVSLQALRGQPVVIYFYPKAFTPLCSAEARKFRDNYPEIQALGAEVIGVSVDTHDVQCRFAVEQGVKFPLIPDHDKAVSRLFGVLWPLLPIDKRVTFVIDAEGVVRAVFHHEIQVLKHLDEVVAFLTKLQAGA
jgi:peroxiredoxin Q/BCP